MNRIAYAKIRNGYYYAANGDYKTGTILGDYRTGFWAYRTDGTRVLAEFDTPRAAAEVLAFDHAMRFQLGVAA